MCLITINTPETTFTNDWLLDFYDHNQDGLGVMYAEGGTLFIEKFVPKTEKSVLNFYHTHVQGKQAVVHWRMRTHGATDMANAHPYEVLNMKEHGIDLWMMHNGVLSGVNADQKHMSDTWHFIRDTMRPMLAAFPDLLKNTAFIELVEERIGSSNKLVFLDNWGNTTVINEKAFTEFSGAQLSNTYAWTSRSRHNLKATEKVVYAKTPSNYGYGYPVDYTKRSLYQSVWDNAEEEEDDLLDDLLATKSTSAYDLENDYEELWLLVEQYPDEATNLLSDYGCSPQDLRDYIVLVEAEYAA
jgi:predicted glutamine amidotransferase